MATFTNICNWLTAVGADARRVVKAVFLFVCALFVIAVICAVAAATSVVRAEVIGLMLIFGAIPLVACGCSWDDTERKGHAAIDWTAEKSKATWSSSCNAGRSVTNWWESDSWSFASAKQELVEASELPTDMSVPKLKLAGPIAAGQS